MRLVLPEELLCDGLNVVRAFERAAQVGSRGLFVDRAQTLRDGAVWLAPAHDHTTQHLATGGHGGVHEVPLGTGVVGDDEQDVARERGADLPERRPGRLHADAPTVGQRERDDANALALGDAGRAGGQAVAVQGDGPMGRLEVELPGEEVA